MTAWINLMPNGRYALLAPHESLPKLYREIASFATHYEAKLYARERFIALVKQYKKPKDAYGPASRPDYGAARPKNIARKTYLAWYRRTWYYQMRAPDDILPLLGRKGKMFKTVIGSMPYEEAQRSAEDCRYLGGAR